MRTASLLLISILLISQSMIGSTKVHVITVDATINPAIAEYINHEIKNAATAGAECIVIRLNTPGGLLKSTRVIVTDILTAPIPVIVYVGPSGSQSASAGTFITLAGHIAAMAPGTNIGAAHPVGMQGSAPDSIMNEKATNDAAAFIRTISEKRKRNVQWAEDAVRNSVSITESEALKENIIDLVAKDIADLLLQIDGKEVEVNERPFTLNTNGAEIVEIEIDWKHELLDILSDPNIAYIFFMLGLYGLMFELYNPGSILPGVIGGISIIIAFYSLHTLPINYAGLALIIFSIILFIAEIKVTSYGMLSVGGVISFVLGSIMLIDTESSLEVISISWGVIIPAVVFTAAFFIFAIGMGIKAQSRKPTTGNVGLVGEFGVTTSDLNPDGQVRVHGEIWNATSTEGRIKRKTAIRVEEVRGLNLMVRKAD